MISRLGRGNGLPARIAFERAFNVMPVTVGFYVCALLLMASGASGQHVLEFSQISSGAVKTKMIDLTSEVRSKCVSRLKSNKSNSKIEIYYQPELGDEAELILRQLERSVYEVNGLIKPAPASNLRYYLLMRSDIPDSYRMRDVFQDPDSYLHLDVISERKQVAFDCTSKTRLCNSIFQTIPHELTHVAVTGLIDPENTRWFEEGLANFVGSTVLEKFAPESEDFRVTHTFARLALHITTRRRALLIWGYKRNSLNHSKHFREEWLRYLSAEAIFRELSKSISEKAEKKLSNKLIEGLISHRESKGTAAGINEIESLIRNEFGVEISQMGILSRETGSSLYKESFERIKIEKSTPQDKDFVMFLLLVSAFPEIDVQNEGVAKLLTTFFLSEPDSTNRHLAATALSPRLNNSGFATAFAEWKLRTKSTFTLQGAKVQIKKSSLF